MTTLARRMSRRAFLRPGLPHSFQDEPVTPEMYGQLVSMYREGRYVETARRAGGRRPAEMSDAQRGFLDQLPPPYELEGFRGRLAASLMHAETLAHFGWNPMAEHRLFRDPVNQLPSEGVRGFPGPLWEEALAAWGEEGVSDFRRLIWREVVLTAARLRLARLDLLAATRILEEAEPLRDAAIGWQLAAVWSVRARYVREDELWSDARELLREAASRRLVSPETARGSSRTVARLLGDSDDLNLRLALVALGQNRHRRAADRLEEVSEQLAAPLRVPRLMLLAETQIAQNRLAPAVANLREAVDLAPTSHAVVAALVAALEARGRWDDAAELATEAMGRRDGDRVWSDFLITWASPREPSLEWLRNLVRA